MRRNRIEEIVDIFGNFIKDTPKESKESKAPEITKVSEEADEAKN